MWFHEISDCRLQSLDLKTDPEGAIMITGLMANIVVTGEKEST